MRRKGTLYSLGTHESYDDDSNTTFIQMKQPIVIQIIQ